MTYPHRTMLPLYSAQPFEAFAPELGSDWGPISDGAASSSHHSQLAFQVHTKEVHRYHLICAVLFDVNETEVQADRVHPTRDASTLVDMPPFMGLAPVSMEWEIARVMALPPAVPNHPRSSSPQRCLSAQSLLIKAMLSVETILCLRIPSMSPWHTMNHPGVAYLPRIPLFVVHIFTCRSSPFTEAFPHTPIETDKSRCRPQRTMGSIQQPSRPY